MPRPNPLAQPPFQVDSCSDLSVLADSQTPRPADAPHARPAGATTYTVALPAGMTLLNANDRMHWRKHNNLKQDIVDAAILVTRQAKIPPLERVTIKAVLHPVDKRRRDPHNWYPSIKAAIDGIVRAGGVLEDDDAKHVLDVSVVLGEPVKRGQLILHLTPEWGDLK
jgi:hypothetical protein